MHVFKSKIDRWILVCFILSVIACLMGVSVMLKIGGTANYVMIAVIIIAGIGFPLWILASTRYIADQENLKIISGPFSWIIPIQSIISIQETQSAITSPALSFDRLEIIYGEDKAIVISPLDKAGLIEMLGHEKLMVVDKISKKISKKNKKNRKNG
ncbi:PH domain-containing protein [Nitrosomonas sp.]|uniref:PH domain-containing protein n=1 Tax=Nitrosomonas sp. TaxID=42353 RepID=UPI001DE404D8|nr:PH domain-containing protein [Nitrosomonas sp.]MBX3616633.1 PH domain-containing protein [Nitrosomonas sp.]